MKTRGPYRRKPLKDEQPTELHGHKSASQRREYALQVEAMRMKILADHLRSVVILLLRDRPGDENCLVLLSKEKIAATLGQKLDSVDSEDKLSVLFSCEPENEEAVNTELKTETLPPDPVLKTFNDVTKGQRPILLNALGQVMEVRDPNDAISKDRLCIHLWPIDGSKGICPHC
jgi:hypothetical protein